MTTREEVWLTAFKAIAGCFNSDRSTALSWADRCLEEFDQRFPQVTAAQNSYLILGTASTDIKANSLVGYNPATRTVSAI